MQNMELAPKDKEILLFTEGKWVIGRWRVGQKVGKQVIKNELWINQNGHVIKPQAWENLPEITTLNN